MLASEPTPGAYAASVANYKILNDANSAKARGILDSVVVRIIVPIGTLILGYLFGVRTGSSS